MRAPPQGHHRGTRGEPGPGPGRAGPGRVRKACGHRPRAPPLNTRGEPGPGPGRARPRDGLPDVGPGRAGRRTDGVSQLHGPGGLTAAGLTLAPLPSAAQRMPAHVATTAAPSVSANAAATRHTRRRGARGDLCMSRFIATSPSSTAAIFADSCGDACGTAPSTSRAPAGAAAISQRTCNTTLVDSLSPTTKQPTHNPRARRRDPTTPSHTGQDGDAAPPGARWTGTADAGG